MSMRPAVLLFILVTLALAGCAAELTAATLAEGGKQRAVAAQGRCVGNGIVAGETEPPIAE